MAIKISVYRYGIGIIVQGAVAEDGNVYLPLQLAGKRRKACTFQDHGSYIRVLLEEVYTMADELPGCFVLIGLRSVRPLPLIPEVDELEADVVITGAFNNVITAQLNPH